MATATKTVSLPELTDDTLRNIENIAQVFELFGGQVATPQDLGDGFTLLKDKAQLVGVELVVVQNKQISDSKFDGGFSVAHIVTRDGRKVIIVDGSTGIHRQLSDYANSSWAGKPIHLPDGLVRSDYETEVEGKMTPATTFYLSY